jgi:uncharacterized membrane-anchored protein
MQSSKQRSIRDILALAVVTLCALVVLEALIRHGTSVEALLPLIGGAVVVVVRWYFGRRTDKMTR